MFAVTLLNPGCRACHRIVRYTVQTRQTINFVLQELKLVETVTDDGNGNW